jgi:hypothetical protein
MCTRKCIKYSTQYSLCVKSDEEESKKEEKSFFCEYKFVQTYENKWRVERERKNEQKKRNKEMNGEGFSENKINNSELATHTYMAEWA